MNVVEKEELLKESILEMDSTIFIQIHVQDVREEEKLLVKNVIYATLKRLFKEFKNLILLLRQVFQTITKF